MALHNDCAAENVSRSSRDAEQDADENGMHEVKTVPST
jgi:hypothetical protein